MVAEIRISLKPSEGQKNNRTAHNTDCVWSDESGENNTCTLKIIPRSNISGVKAAETR